MVAQAPVQRRAVRTRKKSDVAVSIIVPVSERPASLTELYEEYAAPFRSADQPYEFIFAAEPWFADATEPLRELEKSGEPVRVLIAAQAAGTTTLIRLAAERCNADILVTLPSYPRIDARALPKLIAAVERGADLAVARRFPRRDPIINRIQGRAFHVLLGRLKQGRVHDVASGVTAMERRILDEIPLYGDFHRFLPLLALREGFLVVEVPCPQHVRDSHARLYRPGVYLRRLVDVLGLFFLLRFMDKPLRFFGLVGGSLSLAGGAVLSVLFVQRILGQGIANRPLLVLGVLLLVLGVQAIALGLIGEIIVHLHARGRRTYRLDRSTQAHSNAPGKQLRQ